MEQKLLTLRRWKTINNFSAFTALAAANFAVAWFVAWAGVVPILEAFGVSPPTAPTALVIMLICAWARTPFVSFTQ